MVAVVAVVVGCTDFADFADVVVALVGWGGQTGCLANCTVVTGAFVETCSHSMV